MFLSIGMLKLNYFLADIFILSAEKQPIKLSWRKIECLHINLVSDFCKRNNCFLIVDIISTFLCDSFDMVAMDVGVMITGSQKALACAPGIAVMLLAPSAIKRIEKVQCCCQYLDLKLALVTILFSALT